MDPALRLEARPSPANVFLHGYTALRTAGGASGVTLASHSSVDPGRFEMSNPEDCYVAAVVQRTTTADVRRNGRLAHAGVVPVGSVNISEPAVRTETIVHAPNEAVVFLLPVKIVRSVAEQADVALTGLSGIDFASRIGRVDMGIHALAREAQRELREPGPFSKLRMDIIGQEIIIRMLQSHSSIAERFGTRSRAFGGLAAWQLRRACELMEDSLEEGLTLQILAASVDCSPTHFSRAFKQSTGVAPFAWLLNRRIDRAKAMLGDASMSLAEIALAVGFSAQPQFTTAFKRVTGTTPASWRRSNPN